LIAHDTAFPAVKRLFQEFPMRQLIQAILLALAIALPAFAQSDPPARVGRLAHIENSLIFRVDRNDAGSPATLNWPISSGAVLESGERGRAEVWIGATAFRLDDDSQLEFPVVDDTRIDVRLNGGSLAVSILDRDPVDDLVVDTPDGQVRFHSPGRYRIDVLGDRSMLSVQAGQASFGTPRQATPVSAGQKATRWSNGAERLDQDRDQDAFDRWVSARENATLASSTRRHVSPGMTGYQDLDAYGDWQSAPDYGTVWYPRAVADDWAPYRYGRWAWVAPWGWTWIDQAPWGFAPFHYGRWAIIGGRWGWLPGRPVARPVYAPALVGWIGNPGWNVSFSFGAAPAVGWFPLAPREVYVPGYRHSPNYVRQININHVTNVTVIERATRPGREANYINRQSPRAVTVVPTRLLSEGRPITNREMRREAPRELGRAPLARHAPQADWVAPPPRAGRPVDDDRRRNLSDRRSPGDRDDSPPRREERNARPAMPDNRDDGDRFRRPRDADDQRQPGQDSRRERFRQPAESGPQANPAARPAEAGAAPLGRPATPAETRNEPPSAVPGERESRRERFRQPPDAMPAPNADREMRRDPRELPRPEGAAPPPPATPTQPEASRQPVRESAGDANREARRERFRQPPDAMPTPNPDRESRREMREIQRQERTAPPPMTAPAMPEAGRQPVGESGRESGRERFRQPVEATPEARPAPRAVEAMPPPAPPRREMPAAEPRIESRPEARPMPAPMAAPMPSPDRESRREMREAQRMERAAPPPMAAPVMPQRQEMPRPAPEVRMPAPVRDMAPPPAAAPRMEAPRPAPPAAAPAERDERKGRGRHDDERPGR
jgi:hypothetical protein